MRKNYSRWRENTCPYRYFDWSNIFTPIEDNVWADIRYLGLKFYPQFPVGRFFIDFADPVNKIGIEVDGVAWHLDKEKDERRTAILNKFGWRIIRIKGRDTYSESPSEELLKLKADELIKL